MLTMDSGPTIWSSNSRWASRSFRFGSQQPFNNGGSFRLQHTATKELLKIYNFILEILKIIMTFFGTFFRKWSNAVSLLINYWPESFRLDGRLQDEDDHQDRKQQEAAQRQQRHPEHLPTVGADRTHIPFSVSWTSPGIHPPRGSVHPGDPSPVYFRQSRAVYQKSILHYFGL